MIKDEFQISDDEQAVLILNFIYKLRKRVNKRKQQQVKGIKG